MAIEFEYQPAESPCPPVSALDTLPLAEQHPYASIHPFFQDLDHKLLTMCTYRRAEIGDDEQDTILQDHVLITSRTNLFRKWSDLDWSGVYPALPVASDDLDDRSVAAWASGDAEVWWEGCGPDTPCGDGEEPTMRTHAWGTNFAAHVGNLEFWVAVIYIAEQLPPDVESRTIKIFRDLVLTDVQRRERAE